MNDSGILCSASLRETLFRTSWREPAVILESVIDSLIVCLFDPVRIRLIGSWIFLVLLSIAWCYISPFLQFPTSSKRKFFHFAISAVYVSGILWDFGFLCLAAVFALIAFLTAETLRLYGPAFIQRILDNAFSSFLDAKDQGVVVLSHFYLLLGLSLPIWIDYCLSEHGTHTSISYAGVITVGIGDSFAAIVGRAIGRHRWPQRNRTFEGSMAMLLSQMKAFEILSLWDASAFGLLDDRSNIWSVRTMWLIHSAITTLAEAYIEGSDNVLVPMFSVAVLFASTNCEPLLRTFFKTTMWKTEF